MGKGKKDKKAKSSKKSSANLKAIAQNPIVADVVAAALVSMAAALKDSNKARQIAESAGDELGKMTSAGAKKGSVLWDLALQVGRESLKAFAGDEQGKPAKAKAKAKPKKAKKKPAAGAARR